MAFRWGVLLSALWLMTTTVLATAEPQPLWPEGAPASQGEGVGHVPTLEAYPASDATDEGLATLVVPVQNSLLFYQALVEAGVPAEMHLFETGPHGFGLGKDDPALGAWPALCLQWIKGL